MEIHESEVAILDGDESHTARALVVHWTPKERFVRGLKKGLRVVGIAFLAMLPFAFMEPFLFMVWGSIAAFILIFFVGPLIHMHFIGEKLSFEWVVGPCSICREKEAKYTPFVSTGFPESSGKIFTIICSDCGTTASAQTV